MSVLQDSADSTIAGTVCLGLDIIGTMSSIKKIKVLIGIIQKKDLHMPSLVQMQDTNLDQ